MSEDEDASTDIDLELLLSLYSGLAPYLLDSRDAIDHDRACLRSRI
jgi:hypothetical protein